MKPILVFDFNNVLSIKIDDPSHKIKNRGVRIKRYVFELKNGIVDMLKELERDFKIIIWSSARRDNLEERLNALLPENCFDLLSQSDCEPEEREGTFPLFKKNLEVIMRIYNVELQNIWIFDDSPEKIIQKDRLVTVPSECQDLHLLTPFIKRGLSPDKCSQILLWLSETK